jgi:ABC-type dipeptide/oligopeptide/nickel transport system permease subunit
VWILLTGALAPVAFAPLLCNELPLLASGAAPLSPALWGLSPRDLLGMALWCAGVFVLCGRGRWALALIVASLLTSLALPFERVDATAASDVLLRCPVPYSAESVDRELSSASVHWLGTDRYSRDLLALLLYGTRDSLLCALLVTLTVTALGTVSGAWTALVRTPWSSTLMRGLQALDAFPALLAVLVLQSLCRPSFLLMLGWLVLFRWPSQHRLVQGEVRRLEGEAWCAAARSDGASWWGLLRNDMLPHLRALLTTHAALNVALVLAMESALAWLGFGVPAPAVSLGALLRQGQDDLPFLTPLLLTSLALICGLCFAAVLLGRRRTPAEESGRS